MRTSAAVELWSELLARPRGGSQNARDRVGRVLALAGDPHRRLAVVHVTGTNGKTTTARAVDALLSASGLSVARFTSPHLHSPAERMTLEGLPFPELGLAAAYRRLREPLAAVDAEPEGPLPFFSALTALALTAFAEANPDVAVIEVGVGGRDDATNVVDGRVAVICPVAVDHAAVLGGDLAGIAAHKAGIIKRGACVVMAPQVPAVEQVLRDRAGRQLATVAPVRRRVALLSHQLTAGGQRLDIRAYGGRHPGLELPLLGDHQAANAMTAIAAAHEFLATRGETLGPDALRRGLAQITAPGRLEPVSLDPLTLIDASHNPAGMQVTARAVSHSFGRPGPAVVFAAASDKDVHGMLSALAPVTSRIILSTSPNRGLDPGALAPAAAALWERVEVVPDLAEAIAAAQHSSPSGVLVTGGVATAGAARALLGATV